MNNENYIIAIGRQLGAGGAELGRLLSRRFGFNYIDREILVKASSQLEVCTKSLEGIEEKGYSVWNAFNQADVCEMHHMPQMWYMPTESLLFETQTHLLEKAADESSCVIVGRCASYIFENSPKMISIFLHADMETRAERLTNSGKLQLFGDDAEKAILKEDKARGKYFKKYTGRNWLELQNYELCIDTGRISVEEACDIASEYILKRFPELKRHYYKKDGTK